MNRSARIYRVTLCGGAMNLLLLAFKFVAGIVAGSAAMVADAVHSLSDAVTDAVVLLFVHISEKPQDKTHDYGHGKYETLAGVVVGFVLFAVGLGIVYGGLAKVLVWARGEQLAVPGRLAFWAALVSIALKESIFRYTLRQSVVLKSQALEANAWHHRSDALSSVGTALGIGGAIFFGEKWAVLDPLASIVVGLFIVRVSVSLLRGGIGDLTEQSLPDAVEQEMLQLAASVEGVRKPHDLRTRRIGSHYAVELHILVDGNISLRQAHEKASRVEDLLRERYGEDTHVVVHVEPEELL